MTARAAEKNPASPELKELRTALALNRGMKLLDDIAKEMAESTVEQHAETRLTYLTNLFLRIHRDLFVDWQNQGPHEPGIIVDPTDRKMLRETIRGHLLSNGAAQSDENHATWIERLKEMLGMAKRGALPPTDKLFDVNGFLVESRMDPKERRKHCAAMLADFYAGMRQHEFFAYGNDLTRDFFMAALGKLPAFQAVYAADIDFRRLDQKDVEVLHDPKSSPKDLKKAFTHALDSDRTPALVNAANAYRVWPKNVEYIADIPFLSQTDKKGRKCLVTINGGLVPMDSPVKDRDDRSIPLAQHLAQHLVSGQLFAEYPPVRAETHLESTEGLRNADNSEKYLDGFRTTRDEAPLFCLDVNILSGLRPSSHTQLMNLIERFEPKGTSVFRLNDNPTLKHKMLAAAGNDESLIKTIEVAYQHVNELHKQLKAAENKAFTDKIAVPENGQPKLFMSMGGAGSGKSGLEAYAARECNGMENVVITSLDAFRRESFLYKVMEQAKHHADDYIFVEPFANALREWVAYRARGEIGEHNRSPDRYNLVYDGSAITYQPRYAKLVEQFRKAGFTTEAVAFERSYAKSVDKVSERFDRVPDESNDGNRALPWTVVSGKHARMARSVLQAIEDPLLDKFSMFAKGNVVAKTFTLDDGLDAHPELKTMPHLSYAISVPDQNGEKVLKNRVLAIYDVGRFIRMLDKGLMNPHASGPGGDGRLMPSAQLAFQAGRESWQEKLSAPHDAAGAPLWVAV